MSPLDVRETERDALHYLREQLGPRAPEYLTLEGEFAEAPLEGEGATMVFSFFLDIPGAGCDAGRRKHFVAAGQTQANYFPDFAFDAGDAYSFHIGTRFMLAMGIARLEPENEPPGARELLRRCIENCAPGADLETVELAALFRCGEEDFAVYRVRVGGKDYYALGADCPPGFYEKTDCPPQTVLRLHLGKLIRAEARQDPAASGGGHA